MDAETLYRAIQKLSRSTQAIRMPLDRIVELAIRNASIVLNDKAAMIQHLRKAETQKELANNWEVALHRHPSGQFTLVCLALPDNPQDANMLLHRRVINSREACSFCQLVEGSYAVLELVEAKAPTGQPIANELVHKGCALAWQRLKLIALRPDRQPQRDNLI